MFPNVSRAACVRVFRIWCSWDLITTTYRCVHNCIRRLPITRGSLSSLLSSEPKILGPRKSQYTAFGPLFTTHYFTTQFCQENSAGHLKITFSREVSPRCHTGQCCSYGNWSGETKDTKGHRRTGKGRESTAKDRQRTRQNGQRAVLWCPLPFFRCPFAYLARPFTTHYFTI